MDQYCILGRIGEGAHGIVFKAKHIEVSWPAAAPGLPSLGRIPLSLGGVPVLRTQAWALSPAPRLPPLAVCAHHFNPFKGWGCGGGVQTGQLHPTKVP